MSDLLTHITPRDIGYKVEEVFYTNAESDAIVYDEFIDRATNDFGEEQSYSIGSTLDESEDAHTFVCVGEYDLSVDSSDNELQHSEDLIHLKYDKYYDKIERDNPYLPKKLGTIGGIILKQEKITISELGNDDYKVGKYHITKTTTKLTSRYENERVRKAVFNCRLVEWEMSQYGRMDKIFDINNPTASGTLPSVYQHNSRWKMGIKNGDTSVYLIDALDNRVYKKDIYLWDGLDKNPSAWAGHQANFGSSAFTTTPYVSPSSGETYNIYKMDSYPQMSIRAGCNANFPSQNSGGYNSHAVPFPCAMTTIDFGKEGSATYQQFTLGSIQNYSGGDWMASLEPHQGFTMLAWMAVHGLENPSLSKVIIGSTWTCSKLGFYSLFLGANYSGYAAEQMNTDIYDWFQRADVRVRDLTTNRDANTSGSDYSWANNWPIIVYGDGLGSGDATEDSDHFNKAIDRTMNNEDKYMYSIGKNWGWFSNGGGNHSVGGWGMSGFNYHRGGTAGSWMIALAMAGWNHTNEHWIWKHSSRNIPVANRTDEHKMKVLLSDPKPVIYHDENQSEYYYGWSKFDLGSNNWGYEWNSVDGPGGNYFAMETTLVRATHTGVDNAMQLNDTNTNLGTNTYVGKYIHNITEKTRAKITSHTNSTIYHTALEGRDSGGTYSADWDTNDVYEIRDTEDIVVDQFGNNLNREVRFMSGAMSEGNRYTSFDTKPLDGSIAIPTGTDTIVNLGRNVGFEGVVKFLRFSSVSGDSFNPETSTSEQGAFYWVDGEFVRQCGSIIIDTNNNGEKYLYGVEDVEINKTPYKGLVYHYATRNANYAFSNIYMYDWWGAHYNTPPLSWGWAGYNSETYDYKGIGWDTTVGEGNVSPAGIELLMFLVSHNKYHSGLDMRIRDRRVFNDTTNAITETVIHDSGFGTNLIGIPTTILLDNYHGKDMLDYDFIDGDIVRGIDGDYDNVFLVCSFKNKMYGRKRSVIYSDEAKRYEYNFQNEHTNINTREIYEFDKGRDDMDTRVLVFDISQMGMNKLFRHPERSYQIGSTVPTTIDFMLEPTNRMRNGFSSTNNIHKNVFAGKLISLGNLYLGAIKISISLTSASGVPQSVQIGNEGLPYISSTTVTTNDSRYVTTTRIRFTLTNLAKRVLKDTNCFIDLIGYQSTRYDMDYYRADYTKRVEPVLYPAINNETQTVPGNRAIVCAGYQSAITTMTSRIDNPHYRVNQVNIDNTGLLDKTTIKTGISYEPSKTDDFAWKEDRYVIHEDQSYVTTDGVNYVYI